MKHACECDTHMECRAFHISMYQMQAFFLLLTNTEYDNGNEYEYKLLTKKVGSTLWTQKLE